MAAILPPLEERTVLRVLQRGAREAPDRVAVLDETRSLTYREVYDEALRLGGGFRWLGVGRQEPVLLMLDNHVDHAMCWFGLGAVAAIEVPVNVALRAEQLAHVIRDSGAKVLVMEDHYLDRLDGLEDAVAGLTHLVVRGALPDRQFPPQVLGLDELAASEPSEPAESNPWDISGVLYTSGTTGRAKGVLVHEAQTYGRQWPTGPGSPEPGDVTLVVLPIFHVIGQCGGLYNSMIALATAVILPRFSASTFWDTCRKYGITCAPLVGVMGTYLMRQPRSPRDRDHSLQRIAVGTTFAEVEEFRERFGVEVYSTYGLTEAGGMIRGRAEPTGIGWIRPDVEARLVDEFDRDVAPGEPGELVLRPTEPWTFMAGYHNRPDATVEKWRNLWLHTGDVMRERPDGQLVFVDRRVDTIRRGGENISTFEVEHQISLHPDIAECAVVAVREEGAEPEVKAVVVPAPGKELDPVDLTIWMAERIPHYAVPRFLEFLAELPRTPSTQRVTKAELVARGWSSAWDRQAAGLAVTRDGVRELKPAPGSS
ncbi:AMP-binding protein [Blastococcus saxobsidens]|uniref:Crotonobetaine/carnitine-CoA ligase n=1 Tax=Blastococcus saxobsidens TaxID=138336 RepID=A0A4Q7Y4I9_9ACTN|nr:AMP-binding protein [Blastococcus saxobsidens]RZU30983.1 crotonobetaine/carnitine-CoA ligase [Blastococcus saxobsidens]